MSIESTSPKYEIQKAVHNHLLEIAKHRDKGMIFVFSKKITCGSSIKNVIIITLADMPVVMIHCGNSVIELSCGFPREFAPTNMSCGRHYPSTSFTLNPANVGGNRNAVMRKLAMSYWGYADFHYMNTIAFELSDPESLTRTEYYINKLVTLVKRYTIRSRKTIQLKPKFLSLPDLLSDVTREYQTRVVAKREKQRKKLKNRKGK